MGLAYLLGAFFSSTGSGSRFTYAAPVGRYPYYIEGWGRLYSGRTERLPRTTSNVYMRDRNTCQYCGKSFKESELNLDHVLPRRLGGATTWTNIVCSCVECNLRKGEKTVAASGMGLVRTPKKPRWSPFNHIAFKRNSCQSWDHFLTPAGWKVQISDGLS
ncbi:MAG: HNH endonuclease [bacterium]